MGTYTKKRVLFLTKHQLKWEFKNGKINVLGGFWLPAYFFALIDGGAGAFFCCILPDFLPVLPVLSCVIPGLHGKNHMLYWLCEIKKERAFYEEKLPVV